MQAQISAKHASVTAICWFLTAVSNKLEMFDIWVRFEGFLF